MFKHLSGDIMNKDIKDFLEKFKSEKDYDGFFNSKFHGALFVLRKELEAKKAKNIKEFDFVFGGIIMYLCMALCNDVDHSLKIAREVTMFIEQLDREMNRGKP